VSESEALGQLEMPTVIQEDLLSLHLLDQLPKVSSSTSSVSEAPVMAGFVGKIYIKEMVLSAWVGNN
jgi:hypothetical protein